MRVLVVDIGSSSVRAVLYDERGQPVPDATVQKAYEFTYDADGQATVEAAKLQKWVEDSITQLLAEQDGASITAVGMATFVGNMLGIDEDGKPMTPVITYADTRSQTVIDPLRDQIDEADLLQRTGCRLHPAYATTQLYWYQQMHPEIYRDVACWMDFASYLYLQWFGQTRTSYSIASWSGLLNRQQLVWDAAWISLLELDTEQLPDLSDYDHALQGLQVTMAEQWPALADVPFYLAVGDGAAANIGSGAVDETHAALTVGSTSAIRIITQDDQLTVPDGLWAYRVTAAHHLMGGATTEGGTSFAWAQELLSITDEDTAMLRERQPDQHGLTILPLFSGERSPGWRGQARATIDGIQLSTNRIDMIQAIMESVALRLATIAEALLLEQTQIMASGGALSASEVWGQMIADSLNQPLSMIEGETTARGVAILLLSDLTEAPWTTYEPRVISQIKPRPSAVEQYQAAQQRQQDLYHKLYSS